MILIAYHKILQKPSTDTTEGKQLKQKSYNYPFLEYEIKRKGIKKKAMAQALGVDEGTLWHKTCGKRSFTVEQAIFIQKTWFPETPIEVLFQHRKEDLS